METEPNPRADRSGKPLVDGAGRGLAEVLASIRELVSSETASRLDDDATAGAEEDVLILTPEMRLPVHDEPLRSGEILTEGLDQPSRHGTGAPILDEEALRAVVNTIVREELQGELGDRISRNLRKLIRREIGQIMSENQEKRD